MPLKASNPQLGLVCELQSLLNLAALYASRFFAQERLRAHDMECYFSLPSFMVSCTVAGGSGRQWTERTDNHNGDASALCHTVVDCCGFKLA